MFENFDSALLEDPQFKEDSVRELILTPMLSRLGYQPSGKTRVLRSKTLSHPFIYVGTRKHPVKIVPDYTLLHGDNVILVLDAKSPSENILSKDNIQQAYSYAIHPEIRCQNFALCNGRYLAVFSIESQDPLLIIPFEEFDLKWGEIEKYIAPRFLLQPSLRKFAPDLGLKLCRMGLTPEMEIIMPEVRFGLFARVNDNLMTATSNCMMGDEIHCASFDFTPDLLMPILCGLPAPLTKAFCNALARSPFQAEGDLAIEVDLKIHLGSETWGENDHFVPFIIDEVLGSRFNTTPNLDKPTVIPPSSLSDLTPCDGPDRIRGRFEPFSRTAG
jgi:hypothetical protein